MRRRLHDPARIGQPKTGEDKQAETDPHEGNRVHRLNAGFLIQMRDAQKRQPAKRQEPPKREIRIADALDQY